MDIVAVNYIQRARNRIRVLKALEKDVKTNSFLSRELKITVSNMRILLIGLRDNGFIECFNKESFHYKLYKLNQKR